MLEETIKAVQRAEAEADQIIKDAAAQSAVIVDAAKKAAAQLKETKIQEAKEQAKAAKKRAEADANEEFVSVDAKIQEEIASLKREASGKGAQAVDEVIRHLF